LLVFKIFFLLDFLLTKTDWQFKVELYLINQKGKK